MTETATLSLSTCSRNNAPSATLGFERENNSSVLAMPGRDIAKEIIIGVAASAASRRRRPGDRDISEGERRTRVKCVQCTTSCGIPTQRSASFLPLSLLSLYLGRAAVCGDGLLLRPPKIAAAARTHCALYFLPPPPPSPTTTTTRPASASTGTWRRITEAAIASSSRRRPPFAPCSV